MYDDPGPSLLDNAPNYLVGCVIQKQIDCENHLPLFVPIFNQCQTCQVDNVLRHLSSGHGGRSMSSRAAEAKVGR